MKRTQQNQGKVASSLSPAEKVQLVLDWHHDMKVKGKPVASRFDTSIAAHYYHQSKNGNPLSHLTHNCLR
jgi:hypothetical protein